MVFSTPEWLWSEALLHLERWGENNLALSRLIAPPLIITENWRYSVSLTNHSEERRAGQTIQARLPKRWSCS